MYPASAFQVLELQTGTTSYNSFFKNCVCIYANVCLSLCMKVWMCECRCSCRSDISDLPRTGVTDICQLPDMCAENETRVQVLVRLSSAPTLLVETKLPPWTWPCWFGSVGLLPRPQNPRTLLLCSGVVGAKIWDWETLTIS